MWARIWQIIIKEIIQYRHDIVLTIFIFTFPVMQLILVANATAADISGLPIAIFDRDNSALSRKIAQSLANVNTVTPSEFPDDMDAVERLLQRGDVWLAVIIPPDFAADFEAGNRAAQIQIITDGSSVYGGSSALRATEGAINSVLYREFRQGRAVRGSVVPAVSIEPRMRFNTALDKRYNSVPAQFAFIVYQVTLIVAALGLVRERELGTLEQLMVSPMRRRDMLIGKALPAVVIGYVDFLLMLWVLVGVYHIPQRGSWALLLGLSLLFIIAETGWGLMISAQAQSQQQALLVIFPLMMVDLALSGYLVPVENMPLWLQALSAFSPMRHYITIVKALMIKGASLANLWQPALALVGLAVLMAYLSHRFLTRTFE